jgi:hypothetical protein
MSGGVLVIFSEKSLEPPLRKSCGRFTDFLGSQFHILGPLRKIGFKTSIYQMGGYF